MFIQDDRPIHVHAGKVDSHKLEAAFLSRLKELALRPVHTPTEQEIAGSIFAAFEFHEP